MFDWFKKDTGERIDVNEMDGLIGKAVIIDIREPHEYKTGSLKTAKNVPMGNLLSDPGRFLKQGNKYYLLCLSGMRSKKTAKALSRIGFDVVPIMGGMGSYRGENLHR